MSEDDIAGSIEAAGARVRALWEAKEDADDLAERELAFEEALRSLRQLSEIELEDYVVPLSGDPRSELRALVPNVLRWARAHEPDWPERSWRYATILLASAAGESDPNVLSAHLAAFVDLRDPRGSDLACAHAAHPDAAVRETVAAMLASQPTDASVLATWISLSVDLSDEVRNWATFGLAQTRLDAGHPSSSVVREALFARVEDPHEECRGEAWVGLAIARDPRVVPLIHDALAGRRACFLALEAIEEWPRREYLPALAHPLPPWSERAVNEARATCECAED